MALPLPLGKQYQISHRLLPADFEMTSMEAAQDHYSLCFIIKGDRKVITPNMTYNFHAGYVAAMPPFLYHRTVPASEDEYESILIKFSPEFEQQTRDFFNRGSQSTVIATVRVNGVEYLIANATICYINVLPTYSHPTGKRAHLMNVFVKQEYRRKGIAKQLIQMLLDEAKMYGVTEVTLDATETGRYLYQKLGFEDNHEGMVLNIN